MKRSLHHTLTAVTLHGVILAMFAVVAIPTSVFSAAPNRAQTLCEGAGGVWSKDTCAHKSEPTGGITVPDLMQTTVQVILYITAAVSVVMFIIGGFKYVTSGGDQTAVKNAKNTLLYAVIGIVVTIAAFGIVRLVAEGFRAY